MAEEGNNSRSPRGSRDRSASVRDESSYEKRPAQARDRKSLSGMSEKVKATLAPLQGGKKHHPEVEVNLGRESGAAYETVPMGSTPVSHYSTVEAPGTQSFSATAPSGAGGVTTYGTQHHPRTSDVVGSGPRGTGPQEIKGKYEDKADDHPPPRAASPVEEAFARVDNYLPATKPKNKDYDSYVKESGPQLRARVNSILGDNAHEAGFERKLLGDQGLPKLEDTRPVYGEASDTPPTTGDPTLLDRVKDTVTGQLPGYGIYSGKATSGDDNPMPGRLPTPVRDRLPIQDVGMGSNVHSGTGNGTFDRDKNREPGKEGSGVPGHNPNEDQYVLDGSADPIDRFRRNSRSAAVSGTTNPQGGAVLTDAEGRVEQGLRNDDVKRDGVLAKLKP